MSKKESKIKTRKKAVERQQKTKKQRTLLIAGIIGILILGTVVFSLFSSNSIQDAEVSTLRTAPEVGALAPDFELPNNSGELISLSDYRGQPVVLSFMHTW